MTSTKRPSAVTGLRRAAAIPAMPPAAPKPPAEPVSLAAAAKLTRVTLDLSPARYEALKGFADSRHVKQADVLRELIFLLEHDAELAERVASGIAERKAIRAAALRVAEE